MQENPANCTIRQTLMKENPTNTKENPTNTKENPADSKHVCQIVTAVTYSLSDFLSSMFVGLYSLPDFLA